MTKLLLITGACSSMLSVCIGAFGAHALKKVLLVNQRGEVFETAVKYQFYHSLALLFLGLAVSRVGTSSWFSYAGICFVGGIIIFSGSLYVLSITNVGKWGAVTPIGGLFFILGWICSIIGILKAPLFSERI